MHASHQLTPELFSTVPSSSRLRGIIHSKISHDLETKQTNEQDLNSL